MPTKKAPPIPPGAVPVPRARARIAGVGKRKTSNIERARRMQTFPRSRYEKGWDVASPNTLPESPAATPRAAYVKAIPTA
jgi:hypothetical protein